MKIDLLLDDAERKIQGLKILFSLIENNPELILTNVFGNESSSLLTNIIFTSADFSDEPIEFCEFQNYLFTLLIPFLEEKHKGVSVTYDNAEAPTYLIFNYNDVILGYLDIYDRKFVMSAFAHIEEASSRIMKLREKLNSINQQLIRLSKGKDNLLLLAKSPKEVASMIFRHKYNKSRFENQYMDLMNESVNIERQIVDEKLLLEKIKNDLLPLQVKRESVADFFRIRYSYQVEGTKEDILEDEMRKSDNELHKEFVPQIDYTARGWGGFDEPSYDSQSSNLKNKNETEETIKLFDNKKLDVGDGVRR